MAVVCQDYISDFLSRCEIADGHAGMIINLDDRGRAAGDAYVELETRDDMDTGISMHKREMGSRYIEVCEANRLDVEKAKEMQGRDGGGRRDRERGGPRGFTVQLRHDEVHRSTASGSFAEKSSGEKEMEDSDEVVGSTASFFTTEGEMEDGDEEIISSGAVGDTSTGEEMEDSD